MDFNHWKEYSISKNIKFKPEKLALYFFHLIVMICYFSYVAD